MYIRLQMSMTTAVDTATVHSRERIKQLSQRTCKLYFHTKKYLASEKVGPLVSTVVHTSQLTAKQGRDY